MKIIIGNLRKQDRNSSLLLLLKNKIKEPMYEIQYDKSDIIYVFILYLIKINNNFDNGIYYFRPKEICINEKYKSLYLMMFDYLYKNVDGGMNRIGTGFETKTIGFDWIGLYFRCSTSNYGGGVYDGNTWKYMSYHSFDKLKVSLNSIEVNELALFYLLKLYHEPISSNIFNKYKYETKIMISNDAFKFCKTTVDNNTNYVLIDKKISKMEDIYWLVCGRGYKTVDTSYLY